MKLDRRLVEQELSGMIARPVTQPIELVASILAFLDPLDGGAAPPRAPTELFERTLINALLLTQPHSYSAILYGEAPPAPPSVVDRVAQAVRDDPEEQYTLAGLSRLAGLSARALQYGFRERYGLTPMRSSAR